jgi:hypothetical protein
MPMAICATMRFFFGTDRRCDRWLVLLISAVHYVFRCILVAEMRAVTSRIGHIFMFPFSCVSPSYRESRFFCFGVDETLPPKTRADAPLRGGGGLFQWETPLPSLQRRLWIRGLRPFQDLHCPGHTKSTLAKQGERNVAKIYIHVQCK